MWDGTPRLHGGLLTCDPEVPVARPVGSDDVVPVKRPRGRPPRTGARAAARIEVRMSLEELRALKTLAASSGASVADLIRMAVADLAADDGQRGPVVSGRDVLTSVR